MHEPERRRLAGASWARSRGDPPLLLRRRPRDRTTRRACAHAISAAAGAAAARGANGPDLARFLHQLAARRARRARHCLPRRPHVMTLHVLQSGKGTSRPLVVAFGPMAAAKLPAILGPSACIVVDADGHGTETMAQIVDFASHRAGFGAVAATALIGFSIGCSRVRALRVAGATAGAYLLVDGTHANWPPQPWQIAWLRDLADLARGGKALL